jgi:hypothetical protein
LPLTGVISLHNAWVIHREWNTEVRLLGYKCAPRWGACALAKPSAMSSNKHVGGLGSGVVVTLGLVSVAMGLLALDRVVGWDATWRAFGVTPLQPPFFDMHVINDYAACARKGIEPYAPQACNGDNFNIPPTWL